MSLGIDTADALNTIDWPAFHNWKSQYPSFACRYFGNEDSWTYPEFTDARSATAGVLSRIAPITGSSAGRQEADGTTGNDYGQADAQATCASIEVAVSRDQLAIPPGGVLVYLDVENTTSISPAYWAGWANEVYFYTKDGISPFFPAVYTSMVRQSSGKYLPASNTTYALGEASHYWPSQMVACYGYWASEPEPCAACAPDYDAGPAFANFGTYKQPLGGGSTQDVSAQLYQYAQRGGCTVTCGYDPSTWAGGQNVDIDGSDNTGADNQMLTIQ